MTAQQLAELISAIKFDTPPENGRYYVPPPAPLPAVHRQRPVAVQKNLNPGWIVLACLLGAATFLVQSHL